MKCIFADNFRKHLKNEAISNLRFVSVHRSKFQDNFYSSLYSLLKTKFYFLFTHYYLLYYTLLLF